MAAYFIMIREKTTDAAALAEYGAKAGGTLAGHSMKPIAFYGALDQVEGAPVEGAVVLEFPDMAAARAWYDSPAYQDVAKLRQAGSVSRVFFIEGV